MLKEGINWFMDNFPIVVVPSKTEELWGEIGNRSIVLYNNTALNEALNKIGYSEESFYVYRNNKEYNYLIYIIGGSSGKPIYINREDITVDTNNNLLHLKFNNFDISEYDLNDDLIIGSSTSELVDTVATSVSNINYELNTISISSNVWTNILNYSNPRIRIVNNRGKIIDIITTDIGNIKNREIVYGSKINVNT